MEGEFELLFSFEGDGFSKDRILRREKMVDLVGKLERIGNVCLGFYFSGNKKGAQEKKKERGEKRNFIAESKERKGDQTSAEGEGLGDF